MSIFYSLLFAAILSLSNGSSPPVFQAPSAPSNSMSNSNDFKEIFSLEDLQFAFKNLKSIVDVIVERINNKLNIVQLAGSIDCTGNSCQRIPDNSVLTISVLDTSRQDASAITLATKKITNLVAFPIAYQIEYDKAVLNSNNKFGQYSIRAEIRRENMLYFTTDTQIGILDNQREPLNTINFNVINVQPSSVAITPPQSSSRPMMPGGLNEFKPADTLVVGYVNQLKEKISKYLNNHLQLTTNSLVNLEAVSYRAQIVAGKNLFIKVKAENYGHLHVRVFVPLSIYGKDPELAGIHWGPFTASDPIEFIKPDENMNLDEDEEYEIN